MTDEEYQEYFKNIGKLEFFDPNPWVQVANQMIAGDEPISAIKLLTKLPPGYYRDNMPVEFKEILDKITAKLATPHYYMSNIHDQVIHDDGKAVQSIEGTLRGDLIRQEIEFFNSKGYTPHITDLGPGEYWLPIALKELGYKFTYEGIGLNMKARAQAQEVLPSEMVPYIPGSPRVFVACEIIEHLHHPRDIVTDYLRAGGNANVIHISTPKYSFDCSKKKLNWDTEFNDAGHVRTYTPKEFVSIVGELFPEFELQFYDQVIMHIRGVRKG